MAENPRHKREQLRAPAQEDQAQHRPAGNAQQTGGRAEIVPAKPDPC